MAGLVEVLLHGHLVVVIDPDQINECADLSKRFLEVVACHVGKLFKLFIFLLKLGIGAFHFFSGLHHRRNIMRRHENGIHVARFIAEGHRIAFIILPGDH
jgi:hypothetical protein